MSTGKGRIWIGVTSVAAVALTVPMLIAGNAGATSVAPFPMATSTLDPSPTTTATETSSATATPTDSPTASPTTSPSETGSPSASASATSSAHLLTAAELLDATAGDEYTLTLAARSCNEYTDVRANRARNNIMESLQNLGPDTNYGSGQAISPAKEDQPPQSSCQPLVGWQFQLGSGYTGKTAQTEYLSTITGAGRSVTTGDSVPELLPDGNVDGTNTVAGAVTITLTKDELALAKRSSLWVQGGTKDHPLGQAPTFGPVVYGFAALRCANDNVNGDNVEYVNFTSSQRHVFCYYYAVKPPPKSGTIIIKKAVAGQNPDDVAFQFGGNLSYNPGGAFSLKDGGRIEFIRGATVGIESTWRVTETVPDGWTLGIACSSLGDSTTTPIGVNGVDIDLDARDTVTCVFTNTAKPPTGTLQVDKFAQGGGGTFPYTVTDPADGKLGSGSLTLAEGEIGSMGSYTMTSTGTYTVAETLQVTPKGDWALTEVECSNATGRVKDERTATIDVAALSTSKGVHCILTNTFTPNTGSLVVQSKTLTEPGGVSNYTVSPVSTPPDEVPVVRNQVADNPAADVFVTATPVKSPEDKTNALDPQAYVVTGFGPTATPEGSWKLSDVTCTGGTVGSRDLAKAQITVTLPPKGAVTCDFVWAVDQPTTLRVTKAEVLAGGARTSDVTIVTTCTGGTDTTRETLTVKPSEPLPASLDPDMRFVHATVCTIIETSSGGNPVTTAWTVTGPEGSRSGTGTKVVVAINHRGFSGSAYAVTFTNTFTAGTPTPKPTVTPSTDPTDTPGTGESPGTTVPQVPDIPLPLPEVIDPDRPTVVLPGEIGTNAGQKVTVTVTCVPLPIGSRARDTVAPQGDGRYCSVTKSSNGKVTVTVRYRPPVKVTVVISAPATGKYAAFRYTKTWITRA
ncbi:MAG: hypothetical protein IPO93_12780 [Actinobacteria bacterium]|nr:hypothetical protein [Actinomycetota bacterium]